MKYVIQYILVVGLFLIAESCGTSSSQVNHDNQKEAVKQRIFTKADSLDFQSKAKKLDAMFQLYHQKYGLNGNVLVAQKGKIIYEKCFGYSNILQKTSLQLETPFQLASVSKQFTAVAILQLVEKGLVNLNDDVKKFYPNFPYQGITIKLLLSHRAGLADYTYFCDNYVKNKSKAIYNSQVMDIMIKNKPAIYYKPDRKFNYSNTGYMILASIVEKVAGMDFENYVKENIFEPLEMNNSFVYVKGKNIIENKALGYSSPTVQVADDYLNGVVGDKGIYSTVGDLYKWDQGLYSGKIIKPEILAEAFKPYNPDMKAPKNYGFGWRLYNLPDNNTVYYHRGWWRGFQNLLVRIPQDSTTIVVLRNRKTSFHVDFNEVMKVLYPNGIQVEAQTDISSEI